MRDFRDAKAMAHTLRAALATAGFKITVSQSLELVAKALGAADWNTLAAAIRQEAATQRNDASPSPPPIAERLLGSGAHFSRELESTLHRALADANRREHGYATLEHLLLALIDDFDALAVMKACNVDLGALKRDLANYVDNELRRLVNSDGNGATREEITGANVLVAMFAETESPAVRRLGQQDMARQDAMNFILQGIAKAGGDTAA
jgi:Glyoxalase superfamily protein/Clp amino terminal domain, pathogenicity island component